MLYRLPVFLCATLLFVWQCSGTVASASASESASSLASESASASSSSSSLLSSSSSSSFSTLATASITADGETTVQLDSSVQRAQEHQNEGGDLCVSNNDFEYGVDISWPMHHYQPSNKKHLQPQEDEAGTDTSSCNSRETNRIRRNQQERFNDYMQGCRLHWSVEACEENEKERIQMTLQQPKSMKNYTTAGYAKVKAPKEVFNVLQDFWEKNSHAAIHGDNNDDKIESWSSGNIYTNHWEAPTKLLRLGDDTLEGGGIQDRRTIITHVQQVLESWSGQALIPTSMYGVRIYSDGSILAPHVDRLPLVISAIINVAQDVDEPWVLEVIGHNGVAKNVTMEPWDMVLYESHSVIHGRPYPLRGNYFANVFVHFEPMGHTQHHSPHRSYTLTNDDDRLKNMYNRALQQQRKFPKVEKYPYYIRTEREELMWRQDYVFARETSNPADAEAKLRATPGRSAHSAAAEGNLDKLKKLASTNPMVLHQKDHNGWQPIHEAARAGKSTVVEYLIKEGVEINRRTNNGRGATPLWWAEHMLRENHPTIELLKKHGGKSIGPNN